MPSVTTNAIVLRRAEYKENDCMLTLFSPTMGRVEALCRGCRKQKSPLLAASEIFASGEYVLWQGPEHAVISSCQLSDSFYPIRSDYERLSHAVYLLELCLGCVQPDAGDEHLFLLLLRSLAHLSYGSVPPRRVTAVFLMGLVSLQGYRPRVRSCQHCGRAVPLPGEGTEHFAGAFSAQAGGVLCPSCAPAASVRLSAEGIAYLQNIMRRGIASLEDPGECPDAVFDELRRMTEERLEITTRSGRLL